MKYIVAAFLLITFFVGYSQESLPVGSHPSPIEVDHFPTRMHAFVWRNWNLVSCEKMGEVIGCSGKEIEKIGKSMGLAGPDAVPEDFKDRLYFTIIRRNWHLLPYPQLLELLEMDEEELYTALKEDDFLFYKLGSLKPDCEPIQYRAPSRDEELRAREIRSLIRSNFPVQSDPSGDRLSFVQDLKRIDQIDERQIVENQNGLRFIYSYFGAFGDPLLNHELDPYPDGLLSQLANQGINGIWLHVVLSQLCQSTAAFPEFGEGGAERLKSLNRIVQRAKKYGIKVYLYMNEPRTQPESFFKDRQGMGGVHKDGFVTMCTSTAKVQDWIRSSLRHVFSTVQGLGGVFTISASENMTNCASHGLQGQCPRCSKRDYSEIIAEVNGVIEQGVHEGDPDARVIVWDWGWNGHGDGTSIIEKLPKDVWFMSVSEWALPINRGGVDGKVGEYSISSVGPGPRAQRHWKAAKERGLKTVAKVQFNNTWELSTVPWLPCLDLVAEHAQNLAQSDVDGYMLSWSLGGYPSPNLDIANRFTQDPDLSVEQVLSEIAEVRYGSKASSLARQSWKIFSDAFREYPYGLSVLYNGPQQYGPANLLYLEKTGYKSTMVCFPYDDLDSWRAHYPREVLYDQFQKVANKWKEGLETLAEMLDVVEESKSDVAKADYDLAKVCYLHFASVANQIRFILTRDAIMENDGPDNEEDVLIELLIQEEQLAKELHSIAIRDSRVGFEATNQYYYMPQDLMEKVISCEMIKAQLSN